MSAPRRRSPTGRPALAVLVLLAVASPAAGGLIDCPTGAPGLLVYLDEPKVSDRQAASDDEGGALLDEIWLFLDQDRERSWLEEPQGRVHFVACPGRQPTVSGGEFDQGVVSALHNSRVVLELWGRLIAEPTPEGERRWRAILGFLSVPLRFQHDFEGASPDGIHAESVPRGASERPGDVLALFQHAQEIDLFVAAGLGIRSFRDGDAEGAQRHLCRALVLADSALADHPDPELEGVADYLRELSRENLAAAGQAAPPGDALRELLAERDEPCPEAAP